MGVGEELAKQTSGVLTEAYKDVIQPSAQPIGTVASLLPRTIHLWFGKWEQWVVNGEESLRMTEEAIREKVQKIPEDRLREPEPYVAIPAIQQISYCYDSDVLRNMYANLLTSAMDSAIRDEVHPSYVELIKQITPDEAKLLKELWNTHGNGLPLIDLRVMLKDHSGFSTVLRNYSPMGDGVCERPDLTPSYLENLSRLKIIEIRDDYFITDDTAYDSTIESPMVKQLKEGIHLPEGSTFDIAKKILFVTNFGRGFIKCCVEDYGSEQ